MGLISLSDNFQEREVIKCQGGSNRPSFLRSWDTDQKSTFLSTEYRPAQGYKSIIKSKLLFTIIGKLLKLLTWIFRWK